jgi:hypothetical protein
MRDAKRWAEAEFGHADVGDVRRTRRLVQVAAEVANRPAGTVTKACASSASREGAFRLLENRGVHSEAVRAAMEASTMKRCREQRQVIVPIDGSSLTITDEAEAKGLGGVGAWTKGARGVQTMTALAVTTEGAALGVCGQRMWVRDARSPHGPRGARGKASETRFWTELLIDTHRAFRDQAPGCEPWFQMDRGADCWQVLALGCELDLLMTVRAAYDRRVDDPYGHLWSALERAPVIAKRRVEVAARPAVQRRRRVAGKRIKYLTAPRRARVANVAIRAATIPVRCLTPSGAVLTLNLSAVFVSEQSHADDRLEWMLLTTHSIRTRRDVLEVVRAYTFRWRVEEFHRTWKRGLCRVEDTQLRSRDAIFKWATILAAVATRAMRITYLARTTPTVSAATEFSRTELAALIALREPKGVSPDHLPSLAEAVRWLADIGGYTGPWNGPPGPTVVGRGLYDVLVATRAFENRDKRRRKKR